MGRQHLKRKMDHRGYMATSGDERKLKLMRGRANDDVGFNASTGGVHLVAPGARHYGPTRIGGVHLVTPQSFDSQGFQDTRSPVPRPPPRHHNVTRGAEREE